MVTYDIGAHAGFYTLLFSHLVGRDGRVCAFEPLPRNQMFLREHIELNKLDCVENFEVALSNQSGEHRFQPGNISTNGKLSSSGSMTVQTERLDTLVADETLPPPNFMKIDVEGAERQVLEGAEETLRDHHPTILLSTHGDEVHRTCLDALRDLDYDLEGLKGPVENSSQLLAT